MIVERVLAVPLLKVVSGSVVPLFDIGSIVVGSLARAAKSVPDNYCTYKRSCSVSLAIHLQ